MDLKKIVDEVIVLAREVGDYLKEEQLLLKKGDIKLKSNRNYVTYIDKEAEKRLVEGLGKIVPKASFLAEEETVAYEQRKYTWIIDPLDGTTNFVHGDTPYSVSIALMQESQIVLGVVYDPMANQMFAATGAGRAMLNNEPLKVNRHESLKNAYIGFGIYALDSKENKFYRMP